MKNEEQITFQRLSTDPLKSTMVNKARKKKHVSPESLLLSILNDLFLNSQKLESCFRKTTNSDACSFIGSLNFAKVGNFTSRSNETAPLISEAVAKGNNFDTGTRVGLDVGHLLKSALAGGISCAFSAFLMHPVDTVKTQVQASTTLSFLEILSKIPEIGARGLYKGSIPAVVGQFASHGLRTSIYEASKLAVPLVAPTLLDIQVQSIASFLGTVLGTTLRIPCEVLKQRLQANQFDNIVEATVSVWHQDGLKGLFRGTGVTLLREVPFYVAGMGLYNQSKKVVERQLGRELEPWEAIAVGALSGGLTAVLTTPFDVIKTRMMTAPQGVELSMWMAAYSILTHEGPLAYYKGAVPRFFWTAPLGALNLAGYEILQKAMITPLNQSGHNE
ncbi:binding protein [Arabidopsis lyrata subsp. lyrata]|uniref:Binding protein n=1 Tax=Arabidopsis lyrata subsp. lyrata TaxID=81972 RepID=D7LDG2_ARALL|nr:S-adenosylmethionine mitochondrial carrier protein [Arabidopsis lyrata subsp. lyrata]EFH57040.1 binding protein [Arabidopsis lyrata subsp. lyrata]|eukprot:XP_002880781.1 S-adenosylmethionine mitochondrial carrier protein [Arabidopsis lyrata subsp. lyrata]